MAWSVGQATWVGDLTDPEIAQQVGSRTFERGQAYAAEGRVRSLAARPEGLMLLGTVSGSRDETYQTIVEARPHPKGRSPLWSGRCSCPVGADCKHVVALLLLARDVARGIDPDGVAEGGAEGLSDPDAGAKRVHWSEVLGHVRPRSQAEGEGEARRPEARGDLVPAGLFVDLVYRGGGAWSEAPELGYGLRPTRWTRTGTWHKNLSWHEALPQWRSGLRYLPEHERIMSRLHDAARHGSGRTTFFTGTAPIALDASAEVWPLLGEARRAGIEILPGSGVEGPIRIAEEPARLVLGVHRADDESGDLVLRVEVVGLPDELSDGLPGSRLLIGDPVHGIAVEGDDGSLTFVALDQDLGLDRDGLLQAEAGLRVPAEERARFLRTAVPGLRDRVRVRSEVPLPVPDAEPASWEAPRVTVLVRVTADVPGEVHLDLGHAYDGRARAFSTARFGGTGGARDHEAERAAVEAAASVRAIPGATRLDVLGHPYLLPRVVLRGLDAARFGTDVLPALEADEHVTVELDGDLPVYEEVTSAPVIRLGALDQGRDAAPAAPGEPGDWFDLHVSVEVDGEEVPFEPLFGALARGEEIMLLDSGAWFRLDRPELQRLRALIEEARDIADPETGGLRLSAHHADFWEELVALGVVDEQSARWAASVEALRGVDDGPPIEVPEDLRATLRPYQLDGYRWLSRLWDARLGGILADDMGLGKTLQTIAALARAHDRGELGGVADDASPARGPVLVVAPTSVIGTWLGEFETFAPHLPVVAVAETERRRGRPLADAVAGAEVVVTSYAVLRLDAESFQGVRWGGVVLDEAQFVKNRQAKTHVAVRKLGAPFTIAVTGTPLENSLMDLWSLLSLTAPGLYPRPDVFTKSYRKPIESGERPELLDLLRRRIRPLMLRRTKEQVAIDLPPKQIQVMPIAPHPVHAHIYDQHLQRERQRVLGLLDDPEANRVAILAALTRLRQLSLDPALVDDAHAGKATAAKVEFLVEQLRELAAEGHRALVFSQFTGFLRIVERALTEAGLRTCYLDGTTTDRQSVIRGFRDGQAAAFLISLKAGGFGLTLTEADYVFVLDPWWNPAAEAQAIDRAHRIGQSRPVTVYRLVSAGTIEEKVVALQERKRDLFQRVVDEGGALSGAITSDDVRDLLGLG
ncbi:helicase SNF2 [Intrasporangium oryzae NRRL B-24470]|uniref:Helicase SNF2 n=1 Tax=Intrasporangium oryzae NRRL B-24470 TaxID=1386089 RepID=W9GEQ0_9MICO|nr:DEAD/DEAH box helicase [Intrasporangium oryzae]EWT02359.1 helicase SNF2 [Intrasporangium oryzae NRRL B-24470]